MGRGREKKTSDEMSLNGIFIGEDYILMIKVHDMFGEGKDTKSHICGQCRLNKWKECLDTG